MTFIRETLQIIQKQIKRYQSNINNIVITLH